ncbi:MAG: hypothetical protein IID46_04075 [Planctomycetes bacterium]|nr:hypothetical protein [Planctomycetota bacterium]
MRAVQGMRSFNLIHRDKSVDLVLDDRQLILNVLQHRISSCGFPQHRMIQKLNETRARTSRDSLSRVLVRHVVPREMGLIPKKVNKTNIPDTRRLFYAKGSPLSAKFSRKIQNIFKTFQPSEIIRPSGAIRFF